MSATHTLSLEKLVRDEIDSWKITNNQNGSDVQNAKDLLYGIGLRVTEEVLDELKEYVDFSNFELYLDKHLNPAFEEFKKHYICWHYINSGFKTREAANAAGYGNSEKHKQQAFWQAASNAGLKLKEVKKVLADGTLYTELVASEEQIAFEHEFKGQNYWQIDNLYGIGFGGAYYLSNQSQMIEKLVDSDNSMIDLWSGCGQFDKKINDFVRWQTSQLADGELKSYLVDRNIQSINLFSYQNYLVEGIRLCF